MSDDTILVSVPIPVVGGLAEDGLDDVDRLLLECGATLVRESGPIGRSAPPSKIVCVYAKKLQRLGPCPIPHMAAGVYFVRAGGFIKIGVSKDVRASPYRHPAPRLPDPRPKRSTLRRLARVGDRSCRLYLPFRFRWGRVPRRIGAVALCSALYFLPVALLQAWPAWVRWPLLFAIGLATWAVVDVAMGYLRVLAFRRAAYCPACDGPCRDRLTARPARHS